MKRTDRSKITYPKGISAEDRRFARKLIATLAKYVQDKPVIIGCSGGLDSTVLAHIHSCACTIKSPVNSILTYINHNLRPKEEIKSDIDHLIFLGKKLNMNVFIKDIKIQDGNIQAEASNLRYKALAEIADNIGGVVFLAHQANDIAESKLFQFLTGREANGILRSFVKHGVEFIRPLLDFTREDLERYAKIWNLTWSEDSSNATDKYTRNKIRHHLIPWIEKEINPGIVQMLSQ